jgi:hypothetical protein
MKTVYWIGVAVAAVLSLGAGAGLADPTKPSNCAQPAPVCAVKAGAKQSYWNACQASRDGAFVLLTGECPASPNSDGGGGGGGGM